MRPPQEHPQKPQQPHPTATQIPLPHPIPIPAPLLNTHYTKHTFPTPLLPHEFFNRPFPPRARTSSAFSQSSQSQKPHPYNLNPPTPTPEQQQQKSHLLHERKTLKTLADVEQKCPLYELVQYKCEVDRFDGRIKCLPVVRLFRKCATVMVEVTELERYGGSVA
ncbi:hypothetical protein DFH27DRAFT_534656 [Peziza echinospora]|nr:hypothetical protein DFH27DRAFT_534656 [Peziza echinospora]